MVVTPSSLASASVLVRVMICTMKCRRLVCSPSFLGIRLPIVDEPQGVIQLDGESKVALVFGQMNEPPGARARVALTGLTVAEYFRDEEGQDVLLFVCLSADPPANHRTED